MHITKPTQINDQVVEPIQAPIRGTCSCLGQPCPRFPSDENIISKLAVAVYTNKGGPVEDTTAATAGVIWWPGMEPNKLWQSVFCQHMAPCLHFLGAGDRGFGVLEEVPGGRSCGMLDPETSFQSRCLLTKGDGVGTWVFNSWLLQGDLSVG